MLNKYTHRLSAPAVRHSTYGTRPSALRLWLTRTWRHIAPMLARRTAEIAIRRTIRQAADRKVYGVEERRGVRLNWR